MRKNNLNSVKNKYWLILLLIVSLLLIGLDQVTDGKTPIRFITNYTVIPMQKGISKVGLWLNDLSDNFRTLEELKKEKDGLQEKVEHLTAENTRLRQDTFELDRLRELLKLDETYSDYPTIGARIIGNNGSNWFNEFVIDKGSKDGVKVDSNVLAGGGLVGIVTDVSAHSAKIRSIIDDSSNVSAMVLSTSDTCIVSGDMKDLSSGKIKLEKLANNDNEVPAGEQIVTSHISSNYLQGILIGYVSELTVDSNNLTRSGYLVPAVDFNKLQEVLVVTVTKDELTKSEDTK
ncbi:MAG TPA: rod shape-determining protein MreC [Candidatus Dorea intestinavium]|nr:rod shape-determining protein MreC [Candidatus Dorea intestinavium]